MMRHGRLSQHRSHAQAVGALTGALLLAGGGAVASADAPRNSKHLSPAELAQKVAAATDARLVIVERQQVTPTDATVIDSDARSRSPPNTSAQSSTPETSKAPVCRRQQPLLHHRQRTIRGPHQYRHVAASAGSWPPRSR